MCENQTLYNIMLFKFQFHHYITAPQCPTSVLLNVYYGGGKGTRIMFKRWWADGGEYGESLVNW
jgi:hypothetical protein